MLLNAMHVIQPHMLYNNIFVFPEIAVENIHYIIQQPVDSMLLFVTASLDFI